MATSQNEHYHKIVGLLAAADLRTLQFTYVALDASGTVASSTDGVLGLGILLNKPNTGEPCEIAGPGSIVAAEYNGTVAPGQWAKPTTGGDLVVGAADTDIVVARPLVTTAAGARYSTLVIGPMLADDITKLHTGS